MTKTEPVLCYVDSSWAYFTTQELSEQWGDDWDDVPYEHNAGQPYEFGAEAEVADRETWEIIKVAFDGNFVEPKEGCINSPWSVQSLNMGVYPWLRSSPWNDVITIDIYAGATLLQFCELIRKGGGHVYMRPEDIPFF